MCTYLIAQHGLRICILQKLVHCMPLNNHYCAWRDIPAVRNKTSRKSLLKLEFRDGPLLYIRSFGFGLWVYQNTSVDIIAISFQHMIVIVFIFTSPIVNFTSFSHSHHQPYIDPTL